VIDKVKVAPGYAFIFDMDGVIVESMGVHNRAWDLYLRRQGVSADGIMKRMLGKRNDQIVREIWGGGLTQEEVFRHGAEKERLYREMMAPELRSRLVPGIAEFVESAAEAGIGMALATNAERDNVDFILGGAGLDRLIPIRLDGGQVTHPKPDPEIYLEAARRLGVAPAQCVVFEDSPGGMQAARAAGTRLVALLTTLSAAPEADLEIRDFRDDRLLPWLSRLTLR
jgi:HAD superfamily hydrolase (TIGR01509 family)